MAKVPDIPANAARCKCGGCPSFPGDGGFYCAEIKNVNPRMGFPTLFIDEKCIIGFKEDEVREALGLS